MLTLPLTLALSLVAPQTSAAAQAAPPGVTCLTRAFLDAGGNPVPLSIYVPSGEAETYAALGFTVGSCGPYTINAYRNEACRVAQLGNDAVQARLTQLLGASPRDLCASVLRADPFPVAGGQ